MFTAFFDESEAATVYLIAGWVATNEEWSKFEAAWNQALAADRPIRYFRHHDAKGVQGEFTAWSNLEVASKIDQLVTVICDHEMYGVNGGLRTTTWKKAFESKKLPPKRIRRLFKLTHPYQACFFGTTAAVLQRQIEKGNTTQTVDFVFDEQEGLLKESIKLYEQFKPRFPREQQAIAGTISIGDDRQIPALQAADLLCGEIATNLLTRKPGPAYKRLVTCHKVVQFKSYPPNFERIPGLIRLAEAISVEMKRLNKQSRSNGEPKKHQS